MKKLISYALTLSMLACMATTAFATTDHVVGSHGDSGDAKDVDDGVTTGEFVSSDPSYDLNITVSAGSVQHRYAVDITYSNMEMSMNGGNLVWNVNTLEYESDDDETTAGFANQSFPITITNYSDLPVYLNAAVTDKYASVTNGDQVDASNDDNITIETTLGANTEVGDATDGTAVTETFQVNVTSTDWDAVANFYMPMFRDSNEAITVGTVKLTVSKAALNT